MKARDKLEQEVNERVTKLVEQINKYNFNDDMEGMDSEINQMTGYVMRLVEDLQYKPKKRWLIFNLLNLPKRKTKAIEVLNNHESLGTIEWYSGWRQYVFDDGKIRLAEGCLFELFEKIKKLREERDSTLPNERGRNE